MIWQPSLIKLRLLIVDLCSVYDNKVALKVGGKQVASGELVIINDRFGVRIETVNDSEKAPAEVAEEPQVSQADAEQQSEDFDYSDFEVEEGQEKQEEA